jgi:hypothetical protein
VGLLAERRRARPEELVCGVGVGHEFVVGAGGLEGVTDLAALGGVDQGVLVADQVKEPAADPGPTT